MIKKIRNIKLNVSPDFEFNIIGILTTEKDYKLAWLLNEELSLNLIKSNDIITKDKSGTEQSYISYVSELEDNMFHKLIQNKNKTNYLIEDLKNIDFLFVIYNSITEVEIKNICSYLKKITNIEGVFKIDKNKIKSKNKLMLQI